MSPNAAKPEEVALAVQLDSQAGQLGAALVALATQQAAAIAAQVGQLEAARDDSLWWRCEALDLRQQLAAAQVEAAQHRAQLAQVEGQAAQLCAVVEHHQRPNRAARRAAPLAGWLGLDALAVLGGAAAVFLAER